MRQCLLLTLLVASASYAQLTVQPATKSLLPAAHTTTSGEREDVDAVWAEDFESGLDSWEVGTHSGAVHWCLTNTGNVGGYTPGPLQSSTGFPTGSWIVADSDAQGSDGQAENTTITSPAITGLDTIAHMLLRFEQSFRQLNDDQTLVEVSGNGGTDWMAFPVNAGIGGNQSTPGAPLSEVVTLNISEALNGGSADIRIRFRWISGQGFTYSWQVDDIALIAALPNDLIIDKATHAAWNTEEIDWRDLPCTIYLAGDPRLLNLRATISNHGSLPQTGVYMRVLINGPGGTMADLQTTAIDMAPGATHTFDLPNTPLPSEVGDYDLLFHAEQDATDDAPLNNVVTRSISVAPHTYARDHGILMDGRDNNGAEYVLGNRFWIDGFGHMLHGVDVALGAGTEAGALITAEVYDAGLDLIAETDFHTVQASDVNSMGGSQFITLPFDEAIELIHDRVYMVALHAYMDQGDVWCGISGDSPAQTSLLYRSDVGQWYYTTATPMVRMNFSNSIGLQESTAHNARPTAQPSVFTTTTTFTWQAPGANASWMLTDAHGRMVLSGRSGEQRQVMVGGEGLAPGVYTFTLVTSTGPVSIRVMKING